MRARRHGFLSSIGAGLLVIACNTATALALEQIRAAATVQVVGVIDPGAEKAAAVSRTKKAVVIGTEATISSHAYRNALAKFQIDSHEKACPLLVPLVEEGWTEHAVTEEIAKIYLTEAFADGFSSADVLVLGCTHYPLLKRVLQRVVPRGVILVDSAESTAHAVAKLLSQQTGGSAGQTFPSDSSHATGKIKFFVTDSVQKFDAARKVVPGTSDDGNHPRRIEGIKTQQKLRAWPKPSPTLFARIKISTGGMQLLWWRKSQPAYRLWFQDRTSRSSRFQLPSDRDQALRCARS